MGDEMLIRTKKNVYQPLHRRNLNRKLKMEVSQYYNLRWKKGKKKNLKPC